MSELYFPKLVIGSSLSALSYAFLNELPIISIDSNNKKPLIFEYFSNNLNFSFLKTSYRGKLQKCILYDHISFVMSFLGLMPLAEKATELDIDVDNKFIDILIKSGEYKFYYDKLIVFDTNKINWKLSPIKKAKDEYLVMDWMVNKTGIKLPYEYYENKENKFVNKIYIKRNKIFLTLSSLTKAQLDDINFTEYFARKQAEKLIGRKYLVLKPYKEREKRYLGYNMYSNTSSINFSYITDDYIWNEAMKIDKNILNELRTISMFKSMSK